MFPSYIAILSAIRDRGECTLDQLYSVTDIRGETLRYICNYLTEQGYIYTVTSRIFSITPVGETIVGKAAVEMMAEEND